MDVWSHVANAVLEGAFERVIVGDLYCDISLGLYVIRGENVVLIGELVWCLIYVFYLNKKMFPSDKVLFLCMGFKKYIRMIKLYFLVITYLCEMCRI